MFNIKININFITYFYEININILFVIFFFFICNIFFFIKSEYSEYMYPNIFKSVYFLFIIILLNVFCYDLFININFEKSLYIIYENCGNNTIFKTKSNIIIKFIINFMFIILFLCSYDYLKINNINFEYFILIFLLIIVINNLLISNNLMFFFLFIEVFTYILITITCTNKNNQYSIESAIKYFILNGLTSGIMLVGILYLYFLFGTLNIYELNLVITYYIKNDIYFNNLYYIAIYFFLLGFLFKLYIFPFHFWISDIYNSNLNINTIILATISYLLTFYLFIKFDKYIFIYLNVFIYNNIYNFSIITMLIGIILLTFENNTKKIVAYSSIFTSGLLIYNLINKSIFSDIDVLYYLIIYIFNIFSFLLILIPLYINNYKNYITNIKNLNGYYKKNGIYCLYLIIIILNNIGIPGSLLFFGKLSVLTNILSNFDLSTFYIVVICSFFIFGYALRIFIRIFFFKLIPNTGYKKLTKFQHYSGFIIFLLNLIFLFNLDYLFLFCEYIILNI